MDYEFNILYYINMYKKWWKKIVKVVIITMFFTALFTLLSSLLIPSAYLSTVTIISADSGGSTASTIGKFLGISPGGSGEDTIFALIDSKRMSRDISAYLEQCNKRNFRYVITTRPIKAGFAIDVKGNDPAFTEKVANFVVQNLDKINAELNITPNKPMIKVLDPATYGTRQSPSIQITRKMLIAGILAFLITSLYIFFSDYIKKLKTQ